jgi:hypothetical protein
MYVYTYIHTDLLTYIHILSGNDHSSEFVITVLKALLKSCPEGVRADNINGSLPLHMCLSEQDILLEAAGLLLQAYPAAAGIPNKKGYIPLFLCVMRDNSNIELCRALCQSFTNGPKHLNLTKSLPLHFAARRWRPNKELLKLLLKRYPEGAAVVNEYGYTALHCVCATSDDVEAVQMIYDAYPEAIKMKDRQGKTCLHLAVLAVGKDHELAVSREEAEEQAQREQELKAAKTVVSKVDDSSSVKGTLSTKGEGKGAAVGGGVKKISALAAAALAAEKENSDDDDNDEKETTLANQANEMHERSGSRPRRIIQFLIEKWPEALITDNNFLATPVETVLEKARRIKSLSRQISVFGLFDDPPTARLLLNAQKYRSERRMLPPLRPRFLSTLRELNWLARREVSTFI